MSIRWLFPSCHVKNKHKNYSNFPILRILCEVGIVMFAVAECSILLYGCFTLVLRMRTFRHDRCNTIKIPPCLKVVDAKHRSRVCSPSPTLVTSLYKRNILETKKNKSLYLIDLTTRIMTYTIQDPNENITPNLMWI